MAQICAVLNRFHTELISAICNFWIQNKNEKKIGFFNFPKKNTIHSTVKQNTIPPNILESPRVYKQSVKKKLFHVCK